MAEESRAVLEVEAFLAKWPKEQHLVRDCFRSLYQEMRAMAGVRLNFSARPGVSYSLRPSHDRLPGREFFAIVDVVDDEPHNRWLSVCFYDDYITDPEERGECIPGGLPGGDGYCFNVNADDIGLVGYLITRLHEARAASAGEGIVII